MTPQAQISPLLMKDFQRQGLTRRQAVLAAYFFQCEGATGGEAKAKAEALIARGEDDISSAR